MRLRQRKRNGWGGARPGAGRPRKPEPDVEEALPPDEKIWGILFDLRFGPVPDLGRCRDDEELREHWDAWARDDNPTGQSWRETYAWYRFEKGLDRDANAA